MPFATCSFETSSVLLFVAVVLSCQRRRDNRAIAQIALGSVFGVVLEVMNVLLFDTYTYSSLFVLQVFPPPHNVPLCIGLCWGLIIHACMRLSDRIGLPLWSRPFLDGLLALTIDLAIDGIAIRLDGGYWTWTGIPLESGFSTQSFFGVHYGNFVGWFLVLFIFSSLVRFESSFLGDRLRVSATIRAFYLLSTPFVGYYLLYHAVVFSPLPVHFVNDLIFAADIESNVQVVCIFILGYLTALAVLVQLVASAVSKPQPKREPDWDSFVIFGFFHVSFLLLYVGEGYLSQVPLLLPIGIAMLLIDLALHGIGLDVKRLGRPPVPQRGSGEEGRLTRRSSKSPASWSAGTSLGELS